ncbi:MAG: carbohydrate ABC transporter permease [Chloroflexi bacterium]|nr:carbohydrate ABC transporter permease [Chloroflexota bacterium]
MPDSPVSSTALQTPGAPPAGRSRPWSHWLVTGITALLCALWAVPIIWALIVSFRPPSDSLGRGDIWFSDRLTLESYEKATSLAPFFPDFSEEIPGHSYYVNTLEWVLLTLVVQVVTVTLAGFAFAHYNFLGKRYLFYFILMQMMIPTAVLLVPNFITIREFSTATLGIPKFILYKEFDLYDTPLAIALPYFGSAFGTFLMRQAFLGVPRDLVDAGVVDGCRWWHLLRHVYLPPSMPSLVAFGLVSVSFHWNELLWPLVITSDKARPLTMGLLRFTQLTDIGAQWSLVMAATIIIAAPLLLAFLVFQRQFIQSFLYSGMK